MKIKHFFSLYSLFATAIFLGAFLLFQVQPIIGKYILPWFGGTSFVWITSLLFFQTLLLAGYTYAFLLTKMSFKKQILLHLTLIILVTATIFYTFTLWPTPLMPGADWKLPDSYSPIMQVLGVLSVSIGLPYFLLSTTSTLLQRWYSKASTHKTPYTLYAISNAGSLLAIATYPFLIEPLFKIQTQAFIWTAAFILFSALLCMVGVILWRNTKKTGKNELPVNNLQKYYPVSSETFFFWLLLPAISSLLLLSVTHQMTQSVAPIPFLWLLPLGLYLLSFILAFGEKHPVNKNLYAYGTLLLIPSLLLFLMIPVGLVMQLSVYTIFLFCCFMLFHTELYKRKPQPQHLNMFYLIIAAGSVAGASIVAVIAPLFFKGMFWEFYLGLLLCCFFSIFALVADKKVSFSRFLIFNTFIFFIFIIGISFIERAYSGSGVFRNFYGVLRITEKQTDRGKLTCLLNGKIIHGCQHSSPALRNKPIMYYSEKSGVYLAVQSLKEIQTKTQQKNVNIGIIGLGTGTLAAFGQKGDLIKFYELNPVDIELAKTQFTYITDSPATVQLVQGDARLSLEKELIENKKQNFDLFVIDAFNDDAIPVHLLTKEAFTLYLTHLSSNRSIIAVHISTTYIDLRPVIEQVAKHNKMHVAYIQSSHVDDITAPTLWALLSTDKNSLNTPEINKAKQRANHLPQVRMWTDDYSNIFNLLKF